MWERNGFEGLFEAYRRLAVKHHPDKGGDPEKFKEITRAYEAIKRLKRSHYEGPSLCFAGAQRLGEEE